jgi:guanine deaminase
MSSRPKLFYGPVINPHSLDHFHAFSECLISVDPLGNIEWMIEHVPKTHLEDILSEKGFGGHDVIALQDGEFLMPGFIDTHIVMVLFLVFGT